MKRIILAAAAALSFATASAIATEYFTLAVPAGTTENPQAKTQPIDPSDVIQIVGAGGGTTSNIFVIVRMSDGTEVFLPRKDRSLNNEPIITGVESISISSRDNISRYVTWKVISTGAANAPTPSNVAVIPNDAEGDFEVVLESSVDLVTWTAANPGTFGGDTPRRFFRTRIVRKN